MAQTLQKQGDTFALILDETLLQALNISAETPLNVEVSNGSLIVTPASSDISEAEALDALARLRPHYKQMLENLAK